MLQSLLALPLGALLEVLLFLLLYRLSPLSGKQAAVLVALAAITAALLFSLVNWPGADVLAMYIAVLAVTAYLLGIVSSSYELRQAAGAGKRRWFHWGPAVIIIFFLPNLSARIPAMEAPAIQPKTTLLTAKPSWPGVREKYSSINGPAPEITAVS